MKVFGKIIKFFKKKKGYGYREWAEEIILKREILEEIFKRKAG